MRGSSVRNPRIAPVLGALGLATFLILLLVAPGQLSGQANTGTVTGQVVNGETGSPVASAQVFLPGLDLGGLTRSNGRFMIVNVPVGTHEIQVERIGFGTQTQQVSVAEGQTAVVDFQLAQEVLGLDEIVVTGTPGQARRREIGNSIAQLSLDEEVVEPVSNVESLLQGRAPGVNVTMSSGMVGDGANIRIRGNVSAALSNQPLIYVDGIRVASEAYPNLSPATLGQQYGTHATPSPLSDISPSDIERIEIIKGAAATTLYGTEAASGVIQIFTKRGTTGRPVWSATLEQGLNVPNVHGVTHTLRGTDTEEFSGAEDGIAYESITGGTADYLYIDPWMQNAHQQKYSMSVRGSSAPVSYFVSGSFEDDEDLFVTGGMSNYSLRGNISVDMTEAVSFDWNTSYSTRDINNVGCGDNLYGVCSRSSYGGIIRMPEDELAPLVYEPEHFTQIDRLITGGTLRYQPFVGWATKFTVGYDRAENTGRTGVPFGFYRRPAGFLSVQDYLQEMLTLDFASTYTLDLTEGLSSDLSVGFQRITEDAERVEGYSEDFPGPGRATLSTGAVSLAREDRSRVITGGVFTQALFKIQDKYFLTVGVRADGNSAFGQDFGWQVYPKVSGSYIISDEAFWPENLGEMKLRGAWGTAGRAPGAFDAVRTWTPIPWGTQSSFEPRNLGNPELGPETTAEIELGLESSTFDNRLNVDFTWYRQVTSDALLSVSQAPSAGDWGSQLMNVGKLENRGIELSLTGTVIRSRDWTWDLGVDLSTNYSEALDLGGAPAFSVGGFGYIEEGHPIPVIVGSRVTNPDAIADPNIETDYHFGPNLPTHIITPRTTVQLPYGIMVTARGEYQGGHYIQDGASKWALIEGSGRYPTCFDAYQFLDQGQMDQLTAMEKAQCTRDYFDDETFVYPADFFKLREVSVRVPVDEFVPRASNASLTVSGRNLYRWVKDDFQAYDPEAGGWVPGQSFTNVIWQRPAPPKQFTVSLNVRF